jgi:FlaA1/EpsC-like NDP-sugar epimerase
MRVFNRHISTRGLTLFAFETVLVSGTIMAAGHLSGSLETIAGAAWKIVLVTMLCELCFYYNDLYDLTCVNAKSELIIRILQGTGAAAVVLAIVSVVLPAVRMGSWTFLLTLGILAVAMPVWRVAFDGITSDPHLEERVLVVGSGPTAMTVANHMRAQHDFAYRLVGFIEDPSGKSAAGPVLGTPADLPQVIEAYAIDRIVVGLTDRRGKLPIDELLQAKLSGVRVEDAATIYERYDRQDPRRRPQAELAHLLRRLRGLPRDADREAAVRPGRRLDRSRAGRSRHAADRAGRAARLARTDSLPAGTRRRERPAVHALQVPFDADRRRAGHADLGHAK